MLPRKPAAQRRYLSHRDVGVTYKGSMRALEFMGFRFDKMIAGRGVARFESNSKKGFSGSSFKGQDRV